MAHEKGGVKFFLLIEPARPKREAREGWPVWFPVGVKQKHNQQKKPHMTNHTDPALLNTVLQLLSSAGSESFAEGLRLLVNEAMVQERAAALQARPYERTPNRLGFANGFKSKTLNTRLGPIEFDIPQVRGDLDFYPSALEKGLRSEKALMAAMIFPRKSVEGLCC